MTESRREAVVLGASAGGMEALFNLLSSLPAHWPLSLSVVLHLHPEQDDALIDHYARHCPLAVKEAEDKEAILPGRVYFAPPDYHLLVERDRTFSLSRDEKVQHARPSIDVLFESAAEAYGAGLAGVILSGANADGARGLARVKELGGLTLVQDPSEAQHATMPLAAIAAATPHAVLGLERIGLLLRGLAYGNQATR